MEFWRYYRIIRRRRWLILLGMAVCVIAVQVNNSLTKALYTGRTTLMESKGMSREGIPLYPEQYLNLDLQLRLANLANIATSRKVMANAAETLADLGMTTPPEEVIGRTSVEPVRDTNILAVEVTLPNPNEAKVAADVVANEFKRVYGELNNAAVRQSREFIEAQLTTTKDAMIRSQNLLRDFKHKNEIISLDQQSMSIVQRLGEAKTQLSGLTAMGQATGARVKKLDQELSEMPEWRTVNQQTAQNPNWERLTELLASLETEKARMVNGGPGQPVRLAKHPDVIEVNRRIADVRDQLRTVKPEYIAGKGEARNQVFDNGFDRWVAAKADQAATEAQRRAMETVVADTRSELTALPAKEARLVELQTDVQSAMQTYGLMRNKLDEARIREEQARNEVALKTIDEAYVLEVNQRKVMKLALAFLLSPLLGIAMAFLLHYTDNTVKSAQDAEKLLGLPVLSAIPAARAHSLPRQACSGMMDIAYQMLTSNLWVATQNQDANAVVIVSAEPDVGRSVTASNLATSLAGEGARVVLVDADLRQPTQHLIFGVDNKVGLTNLLSGAATLEDVLVPTRVHGLLLVPTGPKPENPVKLLRSEEMKDFADQVKGIADFVIYDTPAGVAFPDPILVAAQVGNAIVVHSAGRVPRGSEAELRARLESVGVRLLGTVLNKVKREDSSGYFHYRRSYEGVGIAKLPGGKKAVKTA